ncbi:MAG: IclR family transcriptional regulator [Rhodobacteraceae bacterium]|nr:IclR family transcriptional regulator [Paracoccaceae bacterium]
MTGKSRIPTNLRTLLILEVVGHSDRALTPTEINEQIGLPKQTVHRLVSTLEAEGFLIKEHASNGYRPSRRLRLIGAGLLHASRFHITRHQILQDIADQVKETVNFVVPEETGMHYLDRIETDWPFRIQMPRGSNVPFHCTASGKSFMASLSKPARSRFVAGLNLKALTKNTHTDEQSLLADLAVCAKRGYSLDAEEFMEDMVASAVPVTDGKGRFVAAIAVHGPKQRLSLDQTENYTEILMDGAQKLKAAIFS